MRWPIAYLVLSSMLDIAMVHRSMVKNHDFEWIAIGMMLMVIEMHAVIVKAILDLQRYDMVHAGFVNFEIMMVY